MRIGLVGFEHRWQEAVDSLGIYDAKCLLPRLRGDQASPDGVSLRPDVFSFVIKAPRQLIDNDPKRDGVEPSNDAAVKFWRASVHRNGVKSPWIADRFRAFLQESGKQHSVVIRCAANDEIVRRVSPVFLEPLNVGFVPSGGHDNRAAPDELFSVSVFEPHTLEPAIFDDEVLNHGVVTDPDSHAARRLIIGIQKCLSSSEEPAVGASQVQRAGKRLLPIHPMRAHPFGKLARFAHRQFGEIQIGRSASYADEVLEMFLFRIWTREKLVGGGMGATDVSRMARISATHVFRSAFQYQHARDDVARCQCRAQSGVAAPDHNYVVFLHLISLPRIHVDKLPGATNKMPATPAML